ncbi:sulfurtransferase [Devosia nitrariae]|uniref:Sulfurtransferase n=1 Tax=Devosia nitrariae TaxID=2071872 RepID=A0ABQ5WDQ4_9HYPH|nr:sulfurtransferase [Devosia nitrariae]GLQ58065.1 sulfurtransferase [Devosia nitrariae]
MRLSTLAAAAVVGLGFVTAGHAERLTDQPLVDAAWLQQNLGDESLVVIDVRDAVENASPYASAHIPGAISAPYSTSGWRLEIEGVPGQFPGVEPASELIGSLGIDNDDHVVIVAQGTNSSEFGAATRVYWTFKVLGHDAVSILNGGARAWEAAGGEVTDVATVLEPATFTPDFRQELLATTADVQTALANGTPLVDGRPAAQYRGEAKSPVARVAGTIPGAVNIDNGLLYDAENASFADAAAIAALADGVGVGADEANIAFCNTGHWASIVWFGLHEVQGNANTRMYDGSLAEWTADPARPVENGV